MDDFPHHQQGEPSGFPWGAIGTGFGIALIVLVGAIIERNLT